MKSGFIVSLLLLLCFSNCLLDGLLDSTGHLTTDAGGITLLLEIDLEILEQALEDVTSVLEDVKGLLVEINGKKVLERSLSEVNQVGKTIQALVQLDAIEGVNKLKLLAGNLLKLKGARVLQLTGCGSGGLLGNLVDFLLALLLGVGTNVLDLALDLDVLNSLNIDLDLTVTTGCLVF